MIAAFEEEVNLDAEVCSKCDFPLAFSDQHVGSIDTDAAGAPEMRVYHLACAPEVLRRAHAEGQGR